MTVLNITRGARFAQALPALGTVHLGWPASPRETEDVALGLSWAGQAAAATEYAEVLIVARSEARILIQSATPTTEVGTLLPAGAGLVAAVAVGEKIWGKLA